MGKRWPGAKLLENFRRCFAYMIQLASRQVLRLGAKNKIVNYLFSREDGRQAEERSLIMLDQDSAPLANAREILCSVNDVAAAQVAIVGSGW